MTIRKGFRKIGEPLNEKDVCKSSGHLPPMNIHLSPGRYEYICPDCGHVTIVNIPNVTMYEK